MKHKNDEMVVDGIGPVRTKVTEKDGRTFRPDHLTPHPKSRWEHKFMRVSNEKNERFTRTKHRRGAPAGY